MIVEVIKSRFREIIVKMIMIIIMIIVVVMIILLITENVEIGF